MNWTPLWVADFPIPPHALAAIACIVLGAVQFALPKGTPVHRALGWVWVVLMASVGISGLFIWEIQMVGLFSPIHLLSLWLLYSLYGAVRDARRGNIKAHKRNMITTYALALCITGLFTFWPGRIMHQILFGS